MAENKKAEALDNTPWGHRWGFADTQFVLNDDGSVEMTGNRYLLSGYKMYDFIPYVEKVLGIKINPSDKREELADKYVAPVRRNQPFIQAVEQAFKRDQFTFDDKVRLLHSHGQTTTDEVYKVLYERLERFADMVFFPETEEDVVRIVELAKAHDICLVPYGGGTSVSCALILPANEQRLIVSVDMHRMNRIEWIDRENLRACVQAGIVGMDLEEQLNKEGLICGHEPDSIELSTLGGWIATNASGMKKNRYGNIEQVVEQIRMVTPEGVIEQVAMPRGSIGVQPQNLLFGNEGNFGLITKAVVKIFPKPEVRKYGSLVFPDMEKGTQFLRRLAYSGFVPASIRLVDNIQFRFGLAIKAGVSGRTAMFDNLKKLYVTKVLKYDPAKMVVATIVMEGAPGEVEHQEKSIYRLAKQFKGLPAGSEAGRRGYMLTYAIAYIRDFVAQFDIIGETFETSVPWSKIHQVCKAVHERAAQKEKELGLPGKFYVSYRITQIYHTGVCIYFMSGLYMKGVKDPAGTVAKMEHSLREAIIENGGSVSHHHGIGKLRKDFMKDTLSDGSIELIRRLKRSTDPKNIFGARNNVLAD